VAADESLKLNRPIYIYINDRVMNVKMNKVEFVAIFIVSRCPDNLHNH